MAINLSVGSMLGPYELLDLVGAGAMGEVWSARDTRLGRRVAIKVLSARSRDDEQTRSRFMREAKAISKLNHQRICALHDVGYVDGVEYLVMEYLEGETLASRIDGGPLPLDQVIRYGVEICDALDHAHSAGIVHRDLKPANIMLTRSGVKLLDFGLAKYYGTHIDPEAMTLNQEENTADGVIVGTLIYTSPEQLRGEPLDARADIFSFGAVLYEMATGKRAFHHTNNVTAIASILNDEPAPIETIVPDMPSALSEIVRRCLTKDRNNRWNCARDLGYVLLHSPRRDVKALDTIEDGYREGQEVSTNATTAARPLDSGTMLRGDFFPDIFDSTSYISRTARSPEDLIYEEIRGGAMISCQFAYSADQGSLHWLALCDDPLYAVFRESIEFLSSRASSVLSALGDDFLASSPDFISLGPGNGHKDRILLKALLQYFDSHQIRSDLFYYPVDVSERIIGTAIRTITNDGALAHRIKCKAIHADFNKLALFRPVFDFRRAPNLFVFLGNTLGNVQNEISFLQKVKAAMCVGDALMIEVRLNTGHLELGGHWDDRKGLNFAPLAQLGVAFDPDQVEYRKEDTVSQIPGTVTMAGHYRQAVIRGKPYSDIFLSCVNYYDRDAFASALTGTALGFELSAVFDARSLGIYVVRKR